MEHEIFRWGDFRYFMLPAHRYKSCYCLLFCCSNISLVLHFIDCPSKIKINCCILTDEKRNKLKCHTSGFSLTLSLWAFGNFVIPYIFKAVYIFLIPLIFEVVADCFTPPFVRLLLTVLFLLLMYCSEIVKCRSQSEIFLNF